MRIIKGLAPLTTVTTANTVNNAVCMYVSTTATTLLTVANTGVPIFTLVVPANQYVFIQKNPTETLAANVAVSVTSIALRD